MHIQLSKNPKSELESNILLRAFWAEIRKEFGKLQWQFSPRRDGKNKIIWFGYPDIGLGNTLKVGVTYKTRKIITGVLIENIHNLENKYLLKLKECLCKAEKSKISSFWVKSNFRYPHAYGRSFYANKIEPICYITDSKKNYPSNDLVLSVEAFDSLDAKSEFKKRSYVIIDILSSFTNLYFESKEPEIIKDLPELKILNNHENLISSDWIDDHPIVNEKLVITSLCQTIIKYFLSNNCNQNFRYLLSACQHFHSACYAEEQGEIWLQASKNYHETAVVRYLSSLEVLSLIGAPNSETCKVCGQTQYKISSCVKDLIHKYCGEPARNMVSELYEFRSKYLHVGKQLSSKSYGGSIIPQISSSDKNGVISPVPMVPLGNLREFTSFCIRSVAKEYMEDV
ncbi:hypothetical protein [Picosynechococcus sp. NKBG15041c]|uniref:hypothetical protein n=1 Tax=Picosynechococcus sp. NKBG15041c TaxID=1407650 RepID=UPI00056E32A5|nr:hypothetical protein [Picosynechococcus sp. NKBG15041c]